MGLEGSQQAAQIARTKSGCEVLVQDFFNLNLPESAFDVIFANASLFHIPNNLLPKEDTEKLILDQLEYLSQENMTKIRADIAENVNNERRFQPPKFPIISI